MVRYDPRNNAGVIRRELLSTLFEVKEIQISFLVVVYIKIVISYLSSLKPPKWVSY
jgi:hypothetical protein